MSIRTLLLCLAIVGAAIPRAAFAQDLSPEDRAAIAQVASDLEADVRASDFAGTLDVIPPPLLAATLEQFGVTADQLRATIDAQMEEALASVTFESFSMAIDDAVPAVTPGVARRYMLIPTETVLAIKDVGRMRSRTQTLAMEDQGRWYLVRIDDRSQVDMLRAVYPDFATVDFQPGTTEALD